MGDGGMTTDGGMDLAAENAALVALLEASGDHDAWSSLTNECLAEGSAVKVLRGRLDRGQDVLFQMEGGDSPDEDYPGRLAQAWEQAPGRLSAWRGAGLDLVTVFDGRFPSRLRAMFDVPPFLFAKGTLLDVDLGVSVVGSRRCSPDGIAFARDVARMLCERHLTVIAGLARGIDTAAHRETLRLGGRTVAFIGTGITRNYPAENADLQRLIGERGLVLSQFWPDQGPTRFTFPMRNALMSGYGMATVVVEASERSGTKSQVRHAQQQGRPVILRDTVAEGTQWGAELRGKPGVFVAHSVADVSRALDEMFAIEHDVDRLLDAVLQSQDSQDSQREVIYA